MNVILALCLLVVQPATLRCRSVEPPPLATLAPSPRSSESESESWESQEVDDTPPAPSRNNIAELLLPLIERGLSSERRPIHSKKVIQVLPIRNSKERTSSWPGLNSRKKHVVEITPLRTKGRDGKPLAYILSPAKQDLRRHNKRIDKHHADHEHKDHSGRKPVKKNESSSEERSASHERHTEPAASHDVSDISDQAQETSEESESESHSDEKSHSEEVTTNRSTPHSDSHENVDAKSTVSDVSKDSASDAVTSEQQDVNVAKSSQDESKASSPSSESQDKSSTNEDSNRSTDSNDVSAVPYDAKSRVDNDDKSFTESISDSTADDVTTENVKEVARKTTEENIVSPVDRDDKHEHSGEGENRNDDKRNKYTVDVSNINDLLLFHPDENTSKTSEEKESESKTEESSESGDKSADSQSKQENPSVDLEPAKSEQDREGQKDNNIEKDQFDHKHGKDHQEEKGHVKVHHEHRHYEEESEYTRTQKKYFTNLDSNTTKNNNELDQITEKPQSRNEDTHSDETTRSAKHRGHVEGDSVEISYRNSEGRSTTPSDVVNSVTELPERIGLTEKSDKPNVNDNQENERNEKEPIKEKSDKKFDENKTQELNEDRKEPDSNGEDKTASKDSEQVTQNPTEVKPSRSNDDVKYDNAYEKSKKNEEQTPEERTNTSEDKASTTPEQVFTEKPSEDSSILRSDDFQNLRSLLDELQQPTVIPSDYARNDILITQQDNLNKIWQPTDREIIELIQTSREALDEPVSRCDRRQDDPEKEEEHPHEHKSYRLSFLFNK